MRQSLPSHTIAQRPPAWKPQDFSAWDWHALPVFAELTRADGQGTVRYPTAVRLCADAQALYAHFDCHDPHIWGTLSQRDDPIFNEEVVEIFIAPGADTPQTYYEFELSPNGVLLDLRVVSPNGTREGIQLDADWNCAEIAWSATRDDANDRWYGFFMLPWRSICESPDIPKVWRANFYRIERPATTAPEYSGWSPTYVTPPDYHRPAHYGTLYYVPHEEVPHEESMDSQ